jgi:hypothetical protein
MLKETMLNCNGTMSLLLPLLLLMRAVAERDSDDDNGSMRIWSTHVVEERGDVMIQGGNTSVCLEWLE